MCCFHFLIFYSTAGQPVMIPAPQARALNVAPNHILFAQNLPDDLTADALSRLFQQYVESSRALPSNAASHRVRAIFGYSVAHGATLAGTLVSRSPVSSQAKAWHSLNLTAKARQQLRCKVLTTSNSRLHGPWSSRMPRSSVNTFWFAPTCSSSSSICGNLQTHVLHITARPIAANLNK